MRFIDSPKSADNTELYRTLTDVCNWIKSANQNGTVIKEFTTTQLNQMISENKLSQSGKIFYDKDTKSPKRSKIVNGSLQIDEF